MATRQATEKPAQQNGNGANGEQQALADAITYEQQIAEEAAKIRDDAERLTVPLYMKLRALLRQPIPKAFIQHVGSVSGKPYESTGVKSVQVQMDRLDAVLTPAWWGYERTFSEGGKLCEVVCWVGESKDAAFCRRDSFGGVQNGSLGNLYKGSFTNAGKRAFAMLGPAWEVYADAADFDPDTNPEAADAQAASDLPRVDTIDSEAVAELVSAYEAAKAKAPDPDQFARDLKLELGAMAVPTPSLNKAFASLTPAQHDDVKRWLGS